MFCHCGQMATVRRHRRIAAEPDVVWSLITEPERIAEWFPGMVAATMSEGDDGPIRTITLGTGMEIEEHIITNDPIARRFQYRIGGGLFRQHLGTIDVIDLLDGTSLAVYGTDAEPAVLALVIGGASGIALDNIADLVGASTLIGEH